MGPARGRSLRAELPAAGRTIGGRAGDQGTRPPSAKVGLQNEGGNDGRTEEGRLLWKWRKSGEKRRGVRTEREAEIGEGVSPKPKAVQRTRSSGLPATSLAQRMQAMERASGAATVML